MTPEQLISQIDQEFGKVSQPLQCADMPPAPEEEVSVTSRRQTESRPDLNKEWPEEPEGPEEPEPSLQPIFQLPGEIQEHFQTIDKAKELFLSPETALVVSPVLSKSQLKKRKGHLRGMQDRLLNAALNLWRRPDRCLILTDTGEVKGIVEFTGARQAFELIKQILTRLDESHKTIDGYIKYLGEDEVNCLDYLRKECVQDTE